MDTLTEEERSFELEYCLQGIQGQCILLHVIPIKLNKARFILFNVLSIILLGIPFLIRFWYAIAYERYPQTERYFYYSFVQLEECDHLYIINYDELVSYAPKEEELLFTGQKEELVVYFRHRYLKYQIKGNKVVAMQYDFHRRLKGIVDANQIRGFSDEQAHKLKQTYGPGTMIIERPSAITLFFRQIFRPLYVFIIFSVTNWFYTRYTVYAIIVTVTTVISLIISLVQLIENNNKVFEMAYYQTSIHVLRQGQVKYISSLELVPGDIAFLKNPIKIPFQGIVIEADALINQSVLTGESVPVVKKADLFEKYRNLGIQIDKNSQVYEGTYIIQTNCQKKMAKFQKYREMYGMPICICRTNFATTKGQLMRVILYPKQQQNQFQRQSYKFLIFLFFLALVSYLILTIKLSKFITPFDMFMKAVDLITITVPPSLPISMTIGILYAVQKLKAKNIFCISPNKIINGGLVNSVCFDKTGTLTQDFMDFKEFVPSKNTQFAPSIINQPSHPFDKSKSQFLFSALGNMAANHSLVWRQDTKQLIGDSMQVKLFQFGQFNLIPFSDNPDIIFSFSSKKHFNGSIYRRFEFDSQVQRMSVICQIEGKFYSFCKGSPQILHQIMKRSSIPPNYKQILKQYTSAGYRVLAIASKKMSKNYKDVTRDDAESDLEFDGFEIFENKLKKQSKDAISQLREANIYPVMITGDNPLTGSSIGYKCNIISKFQKTIIIDWVDGHFKEEEFINQDCVITKQENEAYQAERKKEKENKKRMEDEVQVGSTYAKITQNMNQVDEYLLKLLQKSEEEQINYTLTGSAFNKLFKYDEKAPKQPLSFIESCFIAKVHVYARAKPYQKARIVMIYQRMKKTVAMCGDGANDCAALKQADIGLSLSMAEASISAPFTSKVANVSSLVELLKESRAGFATNFSLFNIMASYSFIQYTSTIISQFHFVYIMDWGFVYWDVFCNFVFILTIGYTKTQQKLSKQIPKSSLFSISNIIPLMILFLLQFLGQVMIVLAIAGPFAQQINYYAVGGDAINIKKYQDDGQFSKDSPQGNVMFLFANHLYISSLLAFSISKPWRQQFYTNRPFMICLVAVEIYNIVLCIVPSLRAPVLNLVYMISGKLNYFILCSALGVSISIYVMHKFILQPLFLYIQEQRYKKQTEEEQLKFIQTWKMQCNFK